MSLVPAVPWDPTVWAAAVAAVDRVTDYRVEAVTGTGESLGDVPVDGVRVSYDGDQAEAWRADFALSDPSMVPQSSGDVLDGRSGTRLRVWWRLLTPQGWMETPCGTFVVEDPRIHDGGTLGITVAGRDPLAVARRGGYGPAVIPVGGLTVPDALAALFGAVAPGMPLSIEPSTETVPPVLDLWERDPATDWTDIAAAAGMRVRTDRWGTITVAADPDPAVVAADWQEGSSCPVTDLDVEINTSTIPRRVVVISSSPEVRPPVSGAWENPDADSQRLTTEMRIQSPTAQTAAACEAQARLTGERWRRPQQAVKVTVPARPDLNYRTPVLLRRTKAAVAGTFQVAGWDLVCAGRDADPAAMTVRMMTRAL